MNTPTTPAANIRSRIAAWLPFNLGWVRRMSRPADDGVGAPIPYMNRYSIREQGPSGHNPWRVYLHHFLAPDSAGHHNHPSRWSFSVVLWGSYTEEILEPCEWHSKYGVHGSTGYPDFDFCIGGRCFQKRRVRWFNFIRANRYHRIAELHPGPGTGPDGRARGVWTLFICGPLSGRGWGFWVPGRGHVPVKASDGK